MKRFLSVLLAIGMLLCLCACGEMDEEVDPSLVVGKVSGQVYENEFIGIGCELSSEWTYLTKEEIAEINGIAYDMYDEEQQELIQDAEIVYDMQAMHFDGTTNINVNLEKVDSRQLKFLDLSSNLKKSAPTLEDTYESLGGTNYTYEVSSATIDGEEIPCLNTQVDLYGTTLYQCIMQIKCSGGYLAAVTVTASDAELVDEVLSCLYMLD